MLKNSVFAQVPGKLPNELFENIISGQSFTLERIVSRGHQTPIDTWLDQDKDEWVILIKGEAKILFEKDNKTLNLIPGDYLHIPAHEKHRVEWTDTDGKTIWLAVHFTPEK